MNIYTHNSSAAMARAVADVYPNPFHALMVEGLIFHLAQSQVKNYNGGIWDFHTDGKVGFWVPDMPSVSVSCENYYENPAMDPITFGAGITLLALNRLVCKFHHDGNVTLAQYMQDRHEDLCRWAYGDDSPLDIAQLYSYLD